MKYNSALYWENRYAKGGHSGRGSYGDLAQWKADILNDFVRRHGIVSVVDFGCGDGNQLALAEYPRYTGYDVSRTAIAKCKERFKGDRTKTFLAISGADLCAEKQAELAISLDVIFHLEDAVFPIYMRNLFNIARRFVAIHSSNSDTTPEAWSPHMRNHCHTEWAAKWVPGWHLVGFAGKKFPGIADFYFYGVGK